MPYDDFYKIDEDYFDTILEEDFHFEGTINSDTPIIIKGSLKGNIESHELVIIGPKSVIEANIKAKNLQCFGKIKGNVIVEEEAYFHNPSELWGDLYVPILTLEKGCILNGKLNMTKKQDKK
ncbi:MAG: polymer-forming cytoskeletal protein, partial [Spirochaetes bacterium]|nr:polymer-forming cytoskeletal protein [Spirochaetota bacterium]